MAVCDAHENLRSFCSIIYIMRIRNVNYLAGESAFSESHDSDRVPLFINGVILPMS